MSKSGDKLRGGGGWGTRGTFGEQACVTHGKDYQPEAAAGAACGSAPVSAGSPPSRPTFPWVKATKSPGMGVPERLDQPLLLLLETGEAGGGPGRGG